MQKLIEKIEVLALADGFDTTAIGGTLYISLMPQHQTAENDHMIEGEGYKAASIALEGLDDTGDIDVKAAELYAAAMANVPRPILPTEE